MLRIEIQPNYLTDEFDVIVELDRTADCDAPTRMGKEVSCGFTVKSNNYDEAVEACMPKISEILRVFRPQVFTKEQFEESADDLCNDFNEEIMLKLLEEVFGEENVKKVPVKDGFGMSIDLSRNKEEEEEAKPDFTAHDLFDNVWDEINKNYSLGDK